jgi:hypothetical protein
VELFNICLTVEFLYQPVESFCCGIDFFQILHVFNQLLQKDVQNTIAIPKTAQAKACSEN